MEINSDQFLKILKEIKALNSSYTLTGSQNFYLAINIDSRANALIEEIEKKSVQTISPIKNNQSIVIDNTKGG
jgi:hypothetical protein